jgi:hypothetical protein
MRYIRSLCSSYRGIGSDNHEMRIARVESSEGSWGDVLWGVCAVFEKGTGGGVYGERVKDLDGESEGRLWEL